MNKLVLTFSRHASYKASPAERASLLATTTERPPLHHAGDRGSRADAREQPHADIGFPQHARHLAECHRVRACPRARLAARSLNATTPCACAHRYDPYAAEGSTTASAGDADNTYENMKSLLALARMKQGAEGGEDDDRGGWKGAGRLKGGWAGGKDLGMIEEPVDPNAMPDSTDSESDSDSDGSVAAARVQVRASSAPSRGIEKRKRKKEKKEKKEKSEPSAHTCTRTDHRARAARAHDSHTHARPPAEHKKHKKEKKAKKSKKSKKSKGSDSDSD